MKNNDPKDSLGDRMKRHELASRIILPYRMPIIIRVDGRAFHTFTRKCQKPFDADIIRMMDHVAVALCEDVGGAVLAYVQSDEISLLVHPYKRFSTQPWFDGRVQKIASIAASTATAAAVEFVNDDDLLLERVTGLPTFDARVFVLPESEVVNYFLWRQQDATRNSVQMLARSIYSHAMCDGKNTEALIAMCLEADRPWIHLRTSIKLGRCVVREKYQHGDVERSRWMVDNEIPVFGQDRDYIGKLLTVEES